MATTIWPNIATALKNTPRGSRAPLVWDPASLLMSRFGFGIEVHTRAELARYGLDGWWERQLAFSRGAGAGYAGHAAVAAQGPFADQEPRRGTGLAHCQRQRVRLGGDGSADPGHPRPAGLEPRPDV